MRKYCLLICFVLLCSISYSQEIDSYDIITPLKLWLLNNEAKAMSELGCDGMIISKNSTPLSILPKIPFTEKKAEEELWTMHRKLYSFLNDTQKIYDLSKRYANGKFAVAIKQARPEVWGYSPFVFTGFGLPKIISTETRKNFLKSLAVVIGLDIKRDADLSARLRELIRSLKDEEYRFLREYMSMFKALYPSEKSVAQLEAFLNQGPKKPFGNGLSEVVDAVKDAFSESESELDTSEDSLEELDSLADSETETKQKEVEQMEAPDPDAANMYDIW